MRERQTRERESVRSAILDAARRLFLTEGYVNVSMRKIAELIEYSPGAIYSYFTNKEDIFFALADEGLQRLRDHCLADREHDGDAIEQLTETIWRFYTFSTEQPEYFSLVFVDASVPRIGREWEQFGAMRDLRHEIEQQAQRCVDEGEFPRADSAAAIYRLLTTAMYGVAVFRLTRRLPAAENADAMARDLLDVTIAGLRSGRELHFDPSAESSDQLEHAANGHAPVG